MDLTPNRIADACLILRVQVLPGGGNLALRTEPYCGARDGRPDHNRVIGVMGIGLQFSSILIAFRRASSYAAS